jgi:hypothetical protein
MNDFIELDSILKKVNDFNWSDTLYLPEEDVWDLTTKGLILDPDDVEDDRDDVPMLAEKNCLIDALSIQTIQSIVKNAYEQRSNCTIEELLEAYLYYFDNDAFIDFEKSGHVRETDF